MLGVSKETRLPSGRGTSKAGSKLALVGDQLVLTTAADKGGMFSNPGQSEPWQFRLGGLSCASTKRNAWVYDGPDLVETLEACQPLAILEEIAQRSNSSGAGSSQFDCVAASSRRQDLSRRE